MTESSILGFGLQLQPQPRMVSIVRRFVEESFEKMVADPDAVHRVSLAVHDQPPEGKYHIVFVSSPSVYWQRRSLNTLACLAGDVISIQV